MRSFSQLQSLLVGAEPVGATEHGWGLPGSRSARCSQPPLGVHLGGFWLEPLRLHPGTASQAVMEKGFSRVILAQTRLEIACRSKFLLCCYKSSISRLNSSVATHGTLHPVHLPHSSMELVGCDSIKATSKLPSFRHQFSVLSFGLFSLKTCITLMFLFPHPVQTMRMFGVEVLPGQGFVLLFHLKPGSMAGCAAAMGDAFVGKPNTVVVQAGLNGLGCCSLGHLSQTPHALGPSFPSVLCV